MRSSDHHLSSYMIGEGTLLVQCAEVFLRRGHELAGIVSSDPEVAKWAESHEIPLLRPEADLAAALSQPAFDYLFSIVNLKVLKDDVIELPRRGAINFHDGPLPQSAGVHVTSWAILNGERTHGVTWHRMTAHVDEGEILKERAVEITPSDTAFSLNVKCYQAGIESFTELLEELSSETHMPRKQDLSRRNYYPRHKRPANAAVISWDQPAAQISRLVRGLEFGPHPNRLGRAKLWLNGGFVICPEVEILHTVPMAPPGTISGISERGIIVAAADREIAVRRLLSIEGKPLSLSEAVARYGLAAETRLEQPPGLRDISRFNEEISRHESYWVRALNKLEPPSVPYLNSVHRTGGPYQSVEMPILEGIPTELLELSPCGRQAIVLAAFAMYLARLGPKAEFDLGVMSRDLDEAAAGFEGLFEAHVPLKVQCDLGQSFKSQCAKLLSALEEIGARRTFVRDVTARYPKLSGLRESGLEESLPVSVELVRSAAGESPRTPSTLCLAIPESADHCRWIFDSNAVCADSIALMMNQFGAFLHEALLQPDKTVGSLSLLSEQERHKLLREWNDTATPYDADLCVHEVFERQVGKTPNTIALICGGEELTYGELNARANQVAHHLRNAGVGPDSLVGLAVRRSPEMMAGLLGILKAGGAYVPLDPSYPEQRLALMIEDSGMPVLVTEECLADTLPSGEARIIKLDTDRELIASQPAENPSPAARPSNLAYVIYTSGSTGRPKGVMVEHRNATNFFTGMDQHVSHTGETVWLAATSLSFDISVLELLWTLGRGLKVVLFEGESSRPASMIGGAATGENRESGSIAGLIRRHGVTHFQCTPTLAKMLIEDPAARDAMASFRQMLIGGEAFPPALALELEEIVKGEVLNMYGPTETTVWSTVWPVRNPSSGMSIGRPIANTEIYLLDSENRPVATGVPAEMLIGGAGVVRGYLNRPDLTAERFIPNPFSDDPESRLYRTGDLARYMPDGNLDFLGRIDSQVKIRGHRIEIGEIETVINSHSDVDQSVVVAREDAAGQKRLVAYIIPANGDGPNVRALRDHIRRKLPDYMMPAHVVTVDTFPQTPNGKIDRKALPAPETGSPEPATAFDAPRTRIEEALARVWAEKLEVERVGRKDNFFDIGGDSLIATQLTSSIRQVCRVDLPLETLFGSPTVAAVAAKLEELFLAQLESGEAAGSGNGRPAAKAPAEAPAATQAPGFEPPKTPTEEKLAQIWAATLGCKQVGRHDDFFQSGGTSLSAMNLFLEIENHFGKRLPISTLIRARTIAQLALLVSDTGETTDEWSSLVPMQEKGSKRPFYCIHASGGNVLFYKDLSAALGEDFPFYGLQCRGIDGKLEPLHTIEEMATLYVKEIRAFQPEGPYSLGGWCMGGNIAYEMAQQLLATGEQVAFLGLFDTLNFQEMRGPGTLAEKLKYVRGKLRSHLTNLRRLKGRERRVFLASFFNVNMNIRVGRMLDQWGGRFPRLTKKLQAMVQRGRPPEAFLEDLNGEISRRYVPQPYAGPLTLIRPRIENDYYDDPMMGWGDLATGKVEMIELPVDPGGMIHVPYVSVLAEALGSCLEKAETSTVETQRPASGKESVEVSTIVKQPDLSAITKTLRPLTFPTRFAVEVCAECNLQCSMCHHPQMKRPKGVMPFQLWKKCADEIAAESPETQCWFSFCGEPLLEPDLLLKMIAYGKSVGLRSLNINSNGMLLDPDLSERILDSGADLIVFGIDGFSAGAYEKLRVGAVRDEVYAKVEYLLEARRKRAVAPEVQVQFIETKDNQHELEAYKEYWLARGANLKIRNMLSWGGKFETPLKVPNEDRIPCPWALTMMHVFWDGRVPRCPGDTEGDEGVGNAWQEPLKVLWGKLGMYRDKHLEHRFDELPERCQSCTDWMTGAAERIRPEKCAV